MTMTKTRESGNGGAMPAPHDFSPAAIMTRANAFAVEQAERAARQPAPTDPRSGDELLDQIRQEIERQASADVPRGGAGAVLATAAKTSGTVAPQARAPICPAPGQTPGTCGAAPICSTAKQTPHALARHRGAPTTFAPDGGNAAARARAHHARRALEQALDHGTALLAALGLPRLVEPGFVAIDPTAAGEALTEAVALLDAMDPDPDLEPSLGAPENHSGTAVLLVTGWRALPPDQRHWADGSTSEHEVDIADEPHGGADDDEETLGWAANVRQLLLGPNTADGDVTAPERHGLGFVRCGPEDAEDDDPGGTDESGIADLDGYHEQLGPEIASVLPWSVGGYVA